MVIVMDWWGEFADFTMRWIDPIGIWFGILTTVPIVWSWVLLTRETRRRSVLYEQIRREPGNRPAILILDLLPQHDIGAAVENYRQQNEDLAAIPKQRIITVRHHRTLVANGMHWLHRELRQAIGQLSRMGVDRVHLFVSGPLPVAAVAGAHLANSFQVTLYHWQGGTYENWGPLKDLSMFG